MYIVYEKGNDTIGYDEWLNDLLDVYRFRIAILSEYVNSMPVKTETDECAYQQVKMQLAAFKETYQELELRAEEEGRIKKNNTFFVDGTSMLPEKMERE
jgi:hypothetical protein